MTPETIRQMDGPALTRLAWEWGLAPEGGVKYICRPNGYVEIVRIDEDGEFFLGEDHEYSEWWGPHEHLVQADAIFRSLRARGWWTQLNYSPTDDGGSAIVQLEDGTGGYVGAEIIVEFLRTDEPLALLRCAVLAVASTQKGASDAT